MTSRHKTCAVSVFTTCSVRVLADQTSLDFDDPGQHPLGRVGMELKAPSLEGRGWRLRSLHSNQLFTANGPDFVSGSNSMHVTVLSVGIQGQIQEN